MTYISFLLLFCSFFPYVCSMCLSSCMVNKYYYIKRRGVTLKSSSSRSLKMGPIDRSYSRACVTITSSGVCFVSEQLASTSFRRQVLSTLLVQRWRGSSGNVRLSNLVHFPHYSKLLRQKTFAFLGRFVHSVFAVRTPGAPTIEATFFYGTL